MLKSPKLGKMVKTLSTPISLIDHTYILEQLPLLKQTRKIIIKFLESSKTQVEASLMDINQPVIAIPPRIKFIP